MCDDHLTRADLNSERWSDFEDASNDLVAQLRLGAVHQNSMAADIEQIMSSTTRDEESSDLLNDRLVEVIEHVAGDWQSRISVLARYVWELMPSSQS